MIKSVWRDVIEAAYAYVLIFGTLWWVCVVARVIGSVPFHPFFGFLTYAYVLGVGLTFFPIIVFYHRQCCYHGSLRYRHHLEHGGMHDIIFASVSSLVWPLAWLIYDWKYRRELGIGFIDVAQGWATRDWSLIESADQY